MRILHVRGGGAPLADIEMRPGSPLLLLDRLHLRQAFGSELRPGFRRAVEKPVVETEGVPLRRMREVSPDPLKLQLDGLRTALNENKKLLHGSPLSRRQRPTVPL